MASEGFNVKVLASRPEEISIENVSDVMQSGDKELILNYLETKNISNPKLFNFNSILWMLKDKEFFEKCVAILKKRKTFNFKIWTFALYHGNYELILDLIQHTPSIVYGI